MPTKKNRSQMTIDDVTSDMRSECNEIKDMIMKNRREGRKYSEAQKIRILRFIDEGKRANLTLKKIC